VAPALATNSVRLRRSASANLSRTPASTSNRKTYTYSAWVKRGQLAGNDDFFLYQATGTGDFGYRFRDDTLQVYVFNGGYIVNLQTTQLFRDPSSWYHIVVATDTTQATAANRIKIYVNGSQVTAFSTATYPAQNYDNLNINTASSPQYIGGSSSYYDGYLTEINFIDGQALTPNYFGATNASTGAWQPATYRGTYGTNGFYLPMQPREGYSVDYLVVAGGGGGGAPSGGGGGGGGAGGFRYLTSQIILSGVTYAVTVGAGGGAGSSGANGSAGSTSVFNDTTSTGGGFGAGYTTGAAGNGGSGGSGGGSAGNNPTTSGGAGNTPSTSPSQGNNGGGAGTIANGTGGGGGGGAGASGSTATTSAGANGGNGTANSITGSSTTYAGGGGGGADLRSSSTVGTGGTGGGGNGGGASSAVAGTANLGGGGGGGQTDGSGVSFSGAAGGSGVVIMRILTSEYSGVTTGSPTVTTDGSYTVVKYTSSGSYTA
jgi:hypothetical protein